MNAGTWILIIVSVAIVIIFMLLRPRAGARKYPEVVQFILYDIKMNQALVDTFSRREKPKTFEHNNWEMYKDRIGFLTETQKDLLRETFGLVDEFNVVIKAAKKSKTNSYKNIDLSKFKELLDKCQKELEDWMITNTGQKDLPLKYPSIWSTLFGERS